ncbi:phage head-tail joining protein [Deefgea piscis]|uniref:phage head-tail joining protein n=1 Tax=Deefgea piscis TaxID=2739061 RepID=UPI001C8214EE|nr:hypothetical protein [Deefgea piscis]QZA80191.1 hypothetical protein K4H25_11675 [Deefgea piscis]
MAVTQAQLDALDGAIATGELEVEYDGKRIKYRSIDELMKARNFVFGQIAQQSPSTITPTSAVAEFSRD